MATGNAINLIDSGIVSYDGAGAFSALANPLTVTNGGQGTASLTAYAVLCGGTTSTNPVQPIASVGTAGQALTSNGAAALPTFQAQPAGTGYVISSGVNTGINPADGQTYFFQYGNALTTGQDSTTRIYVPNSCVARACYGALTVAGTLGSTENSTLYLRVNNTTDYTITSTLKMNATTVTFNSTNIGAPMVAGDYFEIKLVDATFSTNPTLVSIALSIALQ